MVIAAACVMPGVARCCCRVHPPGRLRMPSDFQSGSVRHKTAEEIIRFRKASASALATRSTRLAMADRFTGGGGLINRPIEVVRDGAVAFGVPLPQRRFSADPFIVPKAAISAGMPRRTKLYSLLRMKSLRAGSGSGSNGDSHCPGNGADIVAKGRTHPVRKPSGSSEETTAGTHRR